MHSIPQPRAVALPACPSWCAVAHDPAGADRDGAVYVHHAGPVLADGPFVELAQSVALHPDGATEPEPVRVVMPDGTERSVAEAGALAAALALAVETVGGVR